MKHRGLIGLAAIAAITLLVGCGKSSSNAANTGKDVTISYASWDPDQAKALKKIVSEFEKDNPHIKVKMETTPWDQYWTKIEAATTGGNMPDIVTMNCNEIYKYASNGMLAPLDDMAQKGQINFSNYNKNVTQIYMYKGKHYALPKDQTNIGMWYNKTMFKEAGVPTPTANWTWSDFREAAKKLTNKDKGVYGFAATTDPEVSFYNWIFQNNGKLFDMKEKKSHFNDPNTVEALKFYSDLTLKDKVSPSIDTLQETSQVNLMQSGKVAMMTNGNWLAQSLAANPYSAKNFDVAPLPTGKRQATVTNGLSWAMSSKTKHPKEAAKFLAFLGSKKANKMQADLGIAIPAYNGVGQGWFDKFEGTFPNIGVFKDSEKYGVLRPFNSNTVKTETIETQEMSKMLSGKETPQATADKITQGINEIIKSGK